MKSITWLVAILALVSRVAGEDTEEKKRTRAEKMATISDHMSRHLRKEGGGHGHSQKPPASLMRQARKDELGPKGRKPSSKKRDQHAKKIRRAAKELTEKHRKHLEGPVRDDGHEVPAVQQSLNMKKHRDSRKPSAPNAYAAKNAKNKQSVDKVAKKMVRHFDGTAARDAAVKEGRRTIKAAHDAKIGGRTSGHEAAPMREKIQSSNVKDVQNRLAHTVPKKLIRKDPESENSNPAAEGEE